jgi:ketosteroid isomerase-like protein
MDSSRLTDLEDRVAISDLVNAYAQAVDRRDAGGAAALFAHDGELAVWSEPDAGAPSTVTGREQIAQALKRLDQYSATFHEISSHTVTLDRDVATGRTACVAHHVSGSAPDQRDRVWYLHYNDTFKREPDGWRIARRELRIDIVSESPLKHP